ncbi:hypothetical protein ZYGR_0AY01670 [Zygosaccharomyces rouxii]|uniref:RNA polymerase I-specific transcription initiation factor RRN6 n=1 Tax=Zygosaccharomyces rouxii TaxID=4956 RepID=A0A1Q3AJ75_ZYGRO|nr:hypothetical protein ZYGR_0AY01670 [Zygosaccharomyces rouxii]
MDDGLLPQHFPAGAQLAVGVRGSSMYVPSQEETGKNGGWVRHFEDDTPFNLNEFKIGKDAIVLDDPSNFILNEDDDVGEDRMESLRNVSVESPVDDEVLDDENEFNEQWKETIIKDLRWERLSPSIPSNFSVFQDVGFRKDPMFDTRYGSPISPQDYVPGTLINDITRSDYLGTVRRKAKRETEKLLIFDPVVNDLFVTGNFQTTKDLRNNNDQQILVAFCSGETNSILKLAVLPENKLHLTNGSQWLQEFFAKNVDDEVGTFSTIDLRASIKSIKIATVSSLLGRDSDTVGVLTENALYFIKIDNVDPQTSHISYSMHEPLRSVSFGDFPFADFAFNPWELQQFAVIDIKGNWGVARLPKAVKPGSRIRFIPNMKGSIFDPEELSNWKRIEWSSSYSRLLIINASKMIELDFENDWQLEVVQAKTWSYLRDYRRVDDEFGVLLTSKEIIIVSTKSENEQVSRVISWKHCLDPTDQTLRLSINKLPLGFNMLILTCIFSKGHDKVYVHGFCHDQDRHLVQSVDGPILFCMPHVFHGISSMHFLPYNEEERWLASETQGQKLWFNFLFKDNSTNRLMHCFLTNDEISGFQDQSLVTPEHIDSVSSLLPPMGRHIDQVKSFVAQAKLNLFDDPEKPTDPDSEIFQNFGYQLSEAINRIVESWENQQVDIKQVQPLLSDLTSVPTKYESIEELESLLHQLSDYYRDLGIVFTDFKAISKLLIREESTNFDIFASKLLQCWDIVTPNSLSMTRKVFDTILWSILRFYKSVNYDNMETKLRESLTGPYSEMINHWDEDESQILEDQISDDRFVHESNRPQFLFGSQSQIPTIKSSQSRSVKRGRHPRSVPTESSFNMPFTPTEQDLSYSRISASQGGLLPNTMTPAFSLMSSPTPMLSQSQNSQRPRRKKKRIRGFG